MHRRAHTPITGPELKLAFFTACTASKTVADGTKTTDATVENMLPPFICRMNQRKNEGCSKTSLCLNRLKPRIQSVDMQKGMRARSWSWDKYQHDEDCALKPRQNTGCSLQTICLCLKMILPSHRKANGQNAQDRHCGSLPKALALERKKTAKEDDTRLIFCG